jgi:hypothetical protein
MRSKNQRKFTYSIFTLAMVLLLSAYSEPVDRMFARQSRDRTPPQVHLMVPAPSGKNGWYNAPVAVRAGGRDSDTGIAYLQVSVGGKTWYENALTIRQDGTYMVFAKATDRAGNSATTSAVVNIDMTPPEYQLVIPDSKGYEAWHVSSVPIRVTGSDALSGMAFTHLVVEGDSVSSEISSWDRLEAYDPEGIRSYQNIVLGDKEDAGSSTAVVENSGNYRVSGFVEDIAGNQTPFEADFKMDLIPPEVEILSPKKFFGKITIHGIVNDIGSGVQRVFLDTGSGWQEVKTESGSWSIDWLTDGLKDGEHLIKARVEDTAGNQAFTYYAATVINHIWPVFALIGIPLSFCLIALLDPRRAAWHDLAKSIKKYAHMEKNAMMLGEEIE